MILYYLSLRKTIFPLLKLVRKWKSKEKIKVLTENKKNDIIF